MLVKDLIDFLTDCDPEAVVCFGNRVKRDAHGRAIDCTAGDEITSAIAKEDETGPFVGLC